MTEYVYNTTDEMDNALAFHADKNKQTPEELFKSIVDADMATIVKSTEFQVKDSLYDAYKGATEEDKASVDAIVSKVSEAKIAAEQAAKIEVEQAKLGAATGLKMP